MDTTTGAHHDLDMLGEDECWNLVERSDVGRLAVAIANKPDIFPVNYAVERASDRGSESVGRSLIVHTAPGTKLAAAVSGRGVAFEIDDLDHHSHTGWSVVIKGQAHEVQDLEGLMRAEDLGVDSWADTDKTRFIRIGVDEISGRRITRRRAS